MEVKTGAIKSIANLGRSSEGYWETFNYAIGAATEPGSTMKIASMMAMLEDGAIKLTDTIDLEQGKTVFYEEEMRDAHPHQIEKTTVKHAFEISSNVGIAKLVWKIYGEKNRAGRFVKRLRDFNLDLPTGIEIDGEATPYIKEAYNKDDHWSGTTLPWMSTGYELMLTPLQVLNFYNAIANNGVMMKPYVVSEIQQYGETIETFKPTIIKRRLASKRTIEKAKELLEAVVDSGTARLLQTHQFRFAGKTGTAQINYQKLKARTNVGGYQASFAGYFPAENPVYSCIVVITNPRDFGIYGSEVAGPVFREIADKLFNSRPELQNAVTELPQPVLASNQKPDMVSGKSDEVIQLLKYFELPFFKTTKEPW
ncbi:MAG TPA: penicillin-binding transpeptidase domain-containing protein, partial [Saprospiraceae bacterium]|nr:penicillin-binding transpeptidase domain-containing protein [Saprospiraceae bacterium]